MNLITLNKVKKILKNYNIDVEFYPTSKEFKILSKILENHPKQKEKIGVGIAYFTIKSFSTVRKTDKHFEIVRIDGSSDSFSFHTCFNKKSYLKTNISQAFRSSIDDQTFSFKKEQFKDNSKLICPITGLKINWENSHVDHAPPRTFQNLLNHFLKTNNLSFNQIELVEEKPLWQLKNSFIKNKFIEFHKEYAQLRMVYCLANLQQKKKKEELELI